MPTAHFRSTLLVAALAFAFAFNATAAQRTFVSTSGSDANTASNCSTTSPCRGFGAALTVTDSGGEIIVLTSGGYGPVTINKSVSIIAPDGIYAGISVFSGDGITIATAGVDVTLRGLTLNGLGGTYGIWMTAGNSLTVRNCAIRKFSAIGVYVAGNTQVRLLDSHLEGNYYSTQFANGPTVLVSGSRIIGNTQGLHAYAFGAGVVTKAEVTRSETSGNTYSGIFVQATGGATVELNVQDSVATRNGGAGIATNAPSGTILATVRGSLVSGNSGWGLLAGGSGAKLVASGNTVTRNTYGLGQDASATLQSTSDNTVSDNVTAPTVGTITSLTKI